MRPSMKGRQRRSLARPLVLLVVAGCKSGAPVAVDTNAPARPVPPPIELRLERAVRIDITDDFQPSGLALEGEHILTVSDKHDTAVFEVVLGEANATLRTFVSFTAPID